MNINYELIVDYLLPFLTLNYDNETYELGIYANRHKKYLKENHCIIYYNLLTSNKLNSYLSDMKLWVQKMNNIKNIATEIVNKEIIYSY